MTAIELGPTIAEVTDCLTMCILELAGKDENYTTRTRRRRIDAASFYFRRPHARKAGICAQSDESVHLVILCEALRRRIAWHGMAWKARMVKINQHRIAIFHQPPRPTANAQ